MLFERHFYLNPEKKQKLIVDSPAGKATLGVTEKPLSE